jgi:hypothetical protein
MRQDWWLEFVPSKIGSVTWSIPVEVQIKDSYINPSRFAEALYDFLKKRYKAEHDARGWQPK